MDAYSCNNRTLYHLIWGHPSINKNAPIIPRVPKNIMDAEDKSIKRICTAESLDDCLTGIGPSNIGINFLKGVLDSNKEDIDYDNVLFPFTVMQFDVDRQSPGVMLPGKVAQYVPDAFLTQECWLTLPTMPESVSQLWLVGGKVVPHSLLYEGEKRQYFMISDSQWSDKARVADAEFVQDIFKVTKLWLRQYRNDNKDVSNIPLEKQIKVAEKKKDASISDKRSVNVIKKEICYE